MKQTPNDDCGDGQLDWLTLDRDEHILWSGAPRLQTAVIGVIVGIPLVIVPIVIGDIPAVLAIIGAIPAVAMILWIRHTDYVVSDCGLYHKSGVLSRRVIVTEFDTVQNVSYSQSILGTLFDHGMVEFMTAGSDEAEIRFRFVEQPQMIHRIVETELMRHGGYTGGDVPGTYEQWTTVLDEVRALRMTVEGKR